MFDRLGVRLNGWQRIGLVLSCLWIVPGLLFFDWGSLDRSDEAARSIYQRCSSEALNETIKGREAIPPGRCTPGASNYDSMFATLYSQDCKSGYMDSYYTVPRRNQAQAAALNAVCEVNFRDRLKVERASFNGKLQGVLLPVPAVWLLCWIVIITVRWIRRGFSDAKTAPK